MFNYVLLIWFTLLVFVPIAIILITPLKSNQEYIYSKVWDFPKNILSFENYRVYFQRGKMLLGFKNVFTMISIALVTSIYGNDGIVCCHAI